MFRKFLKPRSISALPSCGLIVVWCSGAGIMENDEVRCDCTFANLTMILGLSSADGGMTVGL